MSDDPKYTLQADGEAPAAPSAEIIAAEEAANQRRAEAAKKREELKLRQQAQEVAQARERQRQMLQTMASFIASGVVTRFPATVEPAMVAKKSIDIAVNIVGMVDMMLRSADKAVAEAVAAKNAEAPAETTPAVETPAAATAEVNASPAADAPNVHEVRP